MIHLKAQARVSLGTPAHWRDELGAHYKEHEFSVVRSGESIRIAFASGSGTMTAQDGSLVLEAEADELASLVQIRGSLASHLLEFVKDEKPEIVWSGDGTDVRVPPNFREMTVRSIRPLGPGMRRLTLTGEDLARFDAFDMHIKVLVPPTGITEPQWPVLGPSGLPVWPEGDARPLMRTYTIRRLDVVKGEMDVDFVIHEDAGPGSNFALRAKPGDVVGIFGPGGRNVRSAEWYLLAGDETALPAIGRILESLPASARGTALIEIADADHQLNLAHPSGFELRWLHRNGATPGTTTLLADAVRATEIPRDRPVFTWAGAEFQTFRAIRSHWRKTCGLDKAQHLAVAYWRKGKGEGEMPADKH
jgi:NADPH-dependent ferric siderophore reductase